MDEVLRGLPFAYAYVDDVLVASLRWTSIKNISKHCSHDLRSNGIVINPAKCQLGVPSLNFLGHVVDHNGVTPLPDKVAAIQALTPPSSLRKLREFLGLVNFYRRFIPRCADLMQPLTDKLKDAKKKKSGHLTNPRGAHGISLSETGLIRRNDAGAPPKRCTLMPVNGRLGHRRRGHASTIISRRSLQPLAFFSKRLQPPETRYSAFGRELLAVYLSIKHFRHLLEGRSFVVYTDYKPVTHAFHGRPDRYSPREIRQLDFISQFTTDLRHIAGKNNLAADALSRAYINNVTCATIDFDAIAAAQETDDEITQLMGADGPPRLQRVSVPSSHQTMLCDMTTGFPRPYVPASFRKSLDVLPNFRSSHFLTNFQRRNIRIRQVVSTQHILELGIRHLGNKSFIRHFPLLFTLRFVYHYSCIKV